MAHRSNDLSLKKRNVQIEEKSELLKIARKSINLFSLYDDENARRISVDGRPKRIELYTF